MSVTPSPLPDETTTGAFNEYPVAIVTAALIAVINAGIVLANAWDWFSITNDQTAALVSFVTAVTALAGAVMHSKVYSPATVARLLGARSS